MSNNPLNEHMDLVTGECRETNGSTRAIILFGSYGRDEGAWIRNRDGRLLPYNDYDLLLVVDKKVDEASINTLCRNLATQIGIKWMDVKQATPRDLSEMKPTIQNYEIKTASKVIHGDPEVLGLIPAIDPTAFSLQEAETLFLNRLWTFMGCLDEKGLGLDRSGEEARFFRNQMAKAVLAVIDMLLLEQNKYCTIQKNRLSRVQPLVGDRDDYGLMEWAVREKLEPSAETISSENITDLYHRTKDLFTKESLSVLSRYYGTRLADCKDLESYFLRTQVYTLRVWARSLKKRSMYPLRRLAVKLAQILILSAWERDGIRQDRLSKGIFYLRKLDKSIPVNIGWDTARLEAARLRMEPDGNSTDTDRRPAQ